MERTRRALRFCVALAVIVTAVGSPAAAVDDFEQEGAFEQERDSEEKRDSDQERDDDEGIVEMTVPVPDTTPTRGERDDVDGSTDGTSVRYVDESTTNEVTAVQTSNTSGTVDQDQEISVVQANGTLEGDGLVRVGRDDDGLAHEPEVPPEQMGWICGTVTALERERTP